MIMPKESENLVYQLKVTLRESKPPVWRRLLIPATYNLCQLHQIIQVAMGWTDSHLHQFIIEDKYYSIPSPDDWKPVLDERRFKLNQLFPSNGYKFIYEYDFGDSWEHQILIEKILPPESSLKHPVCIKGRRACPPEDIGGIWGYEEFLAAMQDDEFDPEEFDIEEVNAILQHLK
jgi:hypothetical protein